MDVKKTAKELFDCHGYDMAHKIADNILTEAQIKWNQKKIDFYLDIKLELDKLEIKSY